MKIVVMVGTRPEVIKMVPVIKRLRQYDKMHVIVCATGQHREILSQAFNDFNIVPDVNLDVMTESQSLGHLSAVLFERFDSFLKEVRPDWMLVQGDTTSVMVAALCAFYHRIRVGHVEAGLRSRNMYAPFPEELNRCVVSLVAEAHFAPTETARQNLLAQNIPYNRILVTGNTVADALLEKLAEVHDHGPELTDAVSDVLRSGKRIVLLTAHRRENHGMKLERIFSAVKRVARMRDDVCFIYPVHPNPLVHDPAQRFFATAANVVLCEPFSYSVLLKVMEESHFIVTDSGGIQEEGCILHKPVLVLRETTERSEGVEAGAAKLVGADEEQIFLWLNRLLDDENIRIQMAENSGALYGDGGAAKRIAQYLDSSSGS